MSAAAATRSGRLRELGRFLEIQNVGLNLPFGLAFLLTAAHGLPRWQTFVLVIIALLAARNAGHAFNRWTDRRLDALNPRTQERALVTGRYSPAFALAMAGGSGAALIVVAGLLNPLSLALAPFALLLIFGYSYTKRFTAFTTVFLGLVEALVPAGVYIAVTGTLPAVALVAMAAMLVWGTAFETIHSIGDLSTDQRAGLFSLPRRLGLRTSLGLVALLHAVALALFGWFGYLRQFGLPFWVALASMGALVAYSDGTLARHLDQVRIPFQRHFLLALLFLAGVALSQALGLHL